MASTPAFAQDAAPAPAAAQNADEAPEGDAIVVTANRREQSAQKVGISLTALSPDALKSVNVQRPEDIAKLVPGLAAVPNAGSAVSSFAIRGVSQPDAAEHQEQPIAIYQDGVYIANGAAAGFPVFDVQRVEILRGPQGTLFGRNATGGLIQFISNKPEEGFHGQIEGALGSYDLRSVQGFVNLGNDRIAGRIAYYHLESDGYVKNLSGPSLLSRNIDGLRGQILFKPVDGSTFTLRLEGFDQNGTSDAGLNTPTYVQANGYPAYLPANVDFYGTGPGNDYYGYRAVQDPYTRSVNDPGLIDKKSRTAALSYDQDLGDLSLHSITAYAHYYVQYREDTDSTPLLQTIYGDGGSSNEFSQEIRLQKDHGQFRWTTGLYYFNIDGDYNVYYDLPTFCLTSDTTSCQVPTGGPSAGLPLDANTPAGARSGSNYSLRTRSVALFAQGEYDLTDKLILTLGARYTWDSQRFNYSVACTETRADACLNLFGYDGAPDRASTLGQFTLGQDASDWSGKIGLNYQATPNVMFYASASKGLKGGGYVAAPDGSTFLDAISFRPEKIYAYEGGVKSTLFDGMMIFNLGGFYYNYHDYQTFFFSGVTAAIFNRPATNKGFEVETHIRPWHGGMVNFNAGYSDFKVKDILTPAGIETQRPVNAPQWTVGWGFNQSIDINENVKLTVGYNGRYTSGRYFNIVNSPIVYEGGFTLHDADVRLDIMDRYWIAGYVTNLTDRAYATERFDQTFNSYGLAHYGEPRTFGVRVGAKF